MTTTNERSASVKKETGFSTFDEMQSYASWMVIKGITKGESLESIMQGVFNVHANWIRGLKKVDGGKV